MHVIAALTFLAVAATALPHTGMINAKEIRDVGIIHTEPEYQGFSQFLLEKIEDNVCYPLNVDGNSVPKGVHIASLQICVPNSCNFYTEPQCAGVSVNVQGPGDVSNVKVPSGNLFKSYACCSGSAAAKAGVADFTLATTPHNDRTGM